MAINPARAVLLDISSLLLLPCPLCPPPLLISSLLAISLYQIIVRVKEWRIVARVLDRLFFILYIATIAVSLATMFPKGADKSDQTET